ncbi:copper homeostasis membrane protein CopD [Erwinia sp. P6884]|uniref:copper homeostasis membrane protein CopD n=1 Tax=Erwinia sp. P6884 TaxID=3141450 RepID=UPI003187C9C5
MSLSLIYVLLRWVHFSALMALAGSSLFSVLLAPQPYGQHIAQRCRQLSGGSAIVALVSALLLLAAQTGMMGDGWQDILRIAIWQAVLQTHFGMVWQWQLAAALTGVMAFALAGRARQGIYLFSAAAQLIGLAFTGHATLLDGVPGIFQRTNQAVHLIAGAFWAGGLLPVLFVMADTRHPSLREAAVRTLMRFSAFGHLAVALVVLSGLINAVIILPDWPPTSFQPYSQLLLLKTVLVAMMCGLALWNRYWLVPRFQQRGGNAAHQFVRATCAELILAGGVLLLVSLFATLEPA